MPSLILTLAHRNKALKKIVYKTLKFLQGYDNKKDARHEQEVILSLIQSTLKILIAILFLCYDWSLVET
jgi:hypothetical protein